MSNRLDSDNLLDITCGCYSTYYIEYYYLILISITHIMFNKISDSDSDSDNMDNYKYCIIYFHIHIVLFYFIFSCTVCIK